MHLDFELPPEMSEALQRFANEKDWTAETAAMAAIAGWLAAHGYLEMPAQRADGDTRTEGSA